MDVEKSTLLMKALAKIQQPTELHVYAGCSCRGVPQKATDNLPKAGFDVEEFTI